MATADELLRVAEETANRTLTADLDTRVISIPATIKVLGVEADDDVHRLLFKVPRYYGEFDLYDFNVYINYENARRGGDVYPVDDLALSEDNESITFSWLVDRFAFMYKGDVQFSICMKKYDGENVVKEFNTTMATLPVLPGLETDTAAIDEVGPGVLDTVLMRLYTVEAASGLGQNGYYSVVKVDENNDGAVFTVINNDGTTSALVKHGKDGEDGHTPVKGVDYLTDEEVASMQNTVNQSAKTYLDTWVPKCVTITLRSSDWIDNMQTVSVDGIDMNTVVFPSPDPSTDENYNAYVESSIRGIAQAINSLTFKCEMTPNVDVAVNIAMYHSKEVTAT